MVSPRRHGRGSSRRSFEAPPIGVGGRAHTRTPLRPVPIARLELETSSASSSGTRRLRATRCLRDACDRCPRPRAFIQLCAACHGWPGGTSRESRRHIYSHVLECIECAGWCEAHVRHKQMLSYLGLSVKRDGVKATGVCADARLSLAACG